MQVVRDANERQQEQHVAIACVTVLSQYVEHLGSILVTGHDAAVGSFSEKIEEAVGRMTVVAGEGEE